jgi:hypothetical protein
MHQQPLVILTYPGHFLLTALTIKSFLLYNSPVPIIIIADDLSRYSWPEYVAQCEKFYKTLANNVSVVAVSHLPEAHAYNQPNSGWVRQQIVKLHLDKLIADTVWFFTDGDVQYHFPALLDSVPYVITRNKDDIQARQNFYVAKMLDIPNPGIIAQHPHMNWASDCRAQVCVSNPPFRSMQADTLKKLRQHLQELRGHTVIQSHTWLYDTFTVASNGDAPFIESEWELIENFRVHVLNQDINLVYYPVLPLSLSGSYNTQNLEFCVTCYVSDRSLGKSWFEQQDIFVPAQIWQQLEQINK